MLLWRCKVDKTKAVIRKVKDKWWIYSKKGKKLSCHSSEKEAKKRLQQIEYFKHKQGGEVYWNVLAAFIQGNEPEDRV